jgi:hypothetical protein
MVLNSQTQDAFSHRVRPSGLPGFRNESSAHATRFCAALGGGSPPIMLKIKQHEGFSNGKLIVDLRGIRHENDDRHYSDYVDRSSYLIRQKNSWVSSGSGSLPSE